MSIRRRLTLMLLVPLVVLKICDSFFNYYNNIVDARLAARENLINRADVIARELQRGTLAHDLADAALSVKKTSLHREIRFKAVDATGLLIAGDAATPLLKVAGSEPEFSDQSNEKGRVLVMTRQVATDKGLILVSVEDTYIGIHKSVEIPIWRDLLWDFFEFDVTLLLLWGGIYFGLRPLDRIRREIDARSADDLRPIEYRDRPAELHSILRSLNRLFETVRSAIQSQNRFVANAAHHLRTPIAGLIAQIELLVADTHDDARRQRLRRLLAELDQLNHGANQLMAIARAESAVSAYANNRAIDVPSIVNDVCGRMVDRAIAKGLALTVDAQVAHLVADRSLIEELLVNLVDNAIKYTPSGGELTVACGTRDGRSYLVVEDTGPGISPGERRRVLERFYRAAGATTPGHGLGLAIVNEIVRLYSAKLTIDGGPSGTGTRIEILWPQPRASD